MATSKLQGALNWFEIPVRDIDAASRFYGAMLGAPLRRERFFDVETAVFSYDHESVGGALVQDTRRQPGATGTVVYLPARDGVAACLDRARAAGAEVLMPVTPIGDMGSIGLVRDPDGNHVGLHAP